MGMQVSQNPQGQAVQQAQQQQQQQSDQGVDDWYRGKDKYRHDNKVKYKRNRIELKTGKGDDDIRVRRLDDGRFQVDVNGTHYHFSEAEMRKLKINGGKGNDRLLIDPSAEGYNIRTKKIENMGVANLGGAQQVQQPTQPGTNPNPQAPLNNNYPPININFNFNMPWMQSPAGPGGWGGLGNTAGWMGQFPPGFWSGYMEGDSLAHSLGFYSYFHGPPPMAYNGVPNAWGL